MTMAATLAGKALVIPLFGIGAVASGESAPLGVMLGALAAAVAVSTPASVLIRKVNLVTTNLGVNIAGNATPILALLLLFAFGRAGSPDLKYLGAGAGLIIAANVIANTRSNNIRGRTAGCVT